MFGLIMCAGPYFAVKEDNLVAIIDIEAPLEPDNPDIQLRSFWERREADGTAEITMSVLTKLRSALE